MFRMKFFEYLAGGPAVGGHGHRALQPFASLARAAPPTGRAFATAIREPCGVKAGPSRAGLRKAAAHHLPGPIRSMLQVS